MPLPDWAAGIRIGGEVSAESILAAAYDGLRLAAVVICFGAANSLANPKRLLRLLPNALYEIGSAVTVAVSVAPQLAESVGRVRRAQKLRRGGRISPRRMLMPVLEDALDRSISLAAAMDARGYGRHGGEPAARRRATTALLVTGLLGACVGLYGLLDSGAPFPMGLPSLAAGIACMVLGFTAARAPDAPQPLPGGRLACRRVARRGKRHRGGRARERRRSDRRFEPPPVARAADLAASWRSRRRSASSWPACPRSSRRCRRCARLPRQSDRDRSGHAWRRCGRDRARPRQRHVCRRQPAGDPRRQPADRGG